MLNSHFRSLHLSAPGQEISECDSVGYLKLGALVAIYGLDSLFESFQCIVDTLRRELRLLGLGNALACRSRQPIVSFSGDVALHFQNGENLLRLLRIHLQAVFQLPGAPIDRAASVFEKTQDGVEWNIRQ